MFEVLESRRLLSVSIQNGVLTVIGTSRGDVISVARGTTGVVVTLSGEESTFDVGRVKSVAVSTGAGDDRVTLALKDPNASNTSNVIVYDSVNGSFTLNAPSSASAFNASIDGGSGADTLSGSDGNDTITGGDGDDIIKSGAGDDKIGGGDDDDTINGGLGSDDISGGDDVDTVDYSDRTEKLSITIDDVAGDGERGNNVFFRGTTSPGTLVYNVESGGVITDLAFGGVLVGTGGAAVGARWALLPNGERDNVRTDIENVWGGAGDDVISGSRFNNVLVGGNGNDTLRGNKGNDHLVGNKGRDKFYGGAGGDLFSGGASSDSVFDFEGDGKDRADSDVENLIYQVVSGTLVLTPLVPFGSARVVESVLTT